MSLFSGRVLKFCPNGSVMHVCLKICILSCWIYAFNILLLQKEYLSGGGLGFDLNNVFRFSELNYSSEKARLSFEIPYTNGFLRKSDLKASQTLLKITRSYDI